MREFFFCFIFALSSFSLWADLTDMYHERLSRSLEYRQAILRLDQARLALAQAERFYIPYVDIATAGTFSGGGITLENGELQPISIELLARFMNIFGADLTLSLPFNWDTDSGPEFEFPELSVSRSLFVESAAELLSARADVLKQEQSLEAVRHAVWTEMLREIFDYQYFIEASEIQDAYTSIIERQMAGARDEQTIRDLKKQWYGMRKNFLESRITVDDISLREQDMLPETLSGLLGELREYGEDIENRTAALKTRKDFQSPETADKNILALRLAADAAERQKKFWFLPYLPNPKLSAGITYDLDIQSLDWQITLGFSVPVVDRGERAAQALARKEGARIAELELERARQTLISSKEEVWNRAEILDIERKLAELTTEEKRELKDEGEQLLKAGYLSEEEYIRRRLDFRLAELASLRTENRYLLYLIDVLRLNEENILPKEE